MGISELEKGIGILLEKEGSLDLDAMLVKSSTFFSELGHMYAGDTWQKAAVDMLVNVTDGTPKSVGYAREQLAVLLDRILPRNPRSTFKSDLTVDRDDESYGYNMTHQVEIPEESTLTLGQSRPESFRREQRLSYLRKLDGLLARMGNKSGEPGIKASVGMADKLMRLMIRSEIQPETADKDVEPGVFLKPDVKSVVNGMMGLTNYHLGVTKNSQLEMVLQD